MVGQPRGAMGWSSGSRLIKLELEAETLIDVDIIVEVFPLGSLLVCAGHAQSDDNRLPESARTVSMLWCERLPRVQVSLGPDPMQENGEKAFERMVQFVVMGMGNAYFNTRHAQKALAPIGIG